MTDDYSRVAELMAEMANNIEIEIELRRHIDLSKPFGSPAPQPDRTRERALLAALTSAEKEEFERRREAMAYECFSRRDFRRKDMWGSYWFEDDSRWGGEER
jgi:hypothetical protein